MTDLTTRYASVTPAQLTTIMGSSTQVLAPYRATNAAIRVSEILVTGPSAGTIVWSQVSGTNAATAQPALAVNTAVTLPANMATTGTYLILGEVSYTYQPAIGLGSQAGMTIYDKSFMSPRLSAAIPLS